MHRLPREYNAAGALDQTSIMSLRAQRGNLGPSVDEPICMIEAAGDYAGTYYYHFDGLGSVVALTDADADDVQKYDYSVWGQVGADDVDHPNPYLFTGRRFDTETGLYYYRARHYHPEIGRFLQTDPIGYGDGMNWYRYCRNNPLALVDPSGRDPCDWVPDKWIPQIYDPWPSSRLYDPIQDSWTYPFDPYRSSQATGTCVVIPAAYSDPEQMERTTEAGGWDLRIVFTLASLVTRGGLRGYSYAKAVRAYGEEIDDLAWKMSLSGSRGWRAFIQVQDYESRFVRHRFGPDEWEIVEVGKPYWVEVCGLAGWDETISSDWGYHKIEQAQEAAIVGAQWYPDDPPYAKWCRAWQERYDNEWNEPNKTP